MTRTKLALLVAVMLSLNACTGAATEPDDPPPTGIPPAVAFTARVEVTGGALHITYQLVNQSGGDLIVLNRVPTYQPGGQRQENAEAVYRTGLPGSHRVQLAKRAFAMPDTDRMTWAHAAEMGGVRIMPGASVSEDVTVALPLTRFHPYGDDLGYGTIALPDPVTDVVFCVGVIRAEDLPLPTPGPTGPTPSAVTLAHTASATAVQHLSCSDPAPL